MARKLQILSTFPCEVELGHPVNSNIGSECCIWHGTDLSLCRCRVVHCAMSVLEGGALGRGGGRGREPELVCEPELFTCVVGRGPPARIILALIFSHERCSPFSW